MGGIVSGLFGGGSQPASTQTVTQKSEPWAQQIPYLQDVMANAQNLFHNNPMTPYQGSTVIPFSNETNQALSQIANLANNPSNVSNAAANNLSQTLNGNYLYGGPGFNAAFQAAAHQIIPQVQSQFALAGHSPDSANLQARLTQSLGDAFASQYGQERENQMKAAALAPQANQAQYLNAQQLLNVGRIKEQLAGQQLQDQIQRYYANQQAPYNQLAAYNQFVQGNYGNTQTQQTPQYRNYASGLLGGASAGASIAPLLGMTGPAGAGIGALLSFL